MRARSTTSIAIAAALACAGWAAAGCGADGGALAQAPPATRGAPADDAAPAAGADAPPARARVDGRSFPDRVLALTFDDGPDARTLELATYLRSERVSATFFVVRDWVAGLSSDPGEGRGVFESGHGAYPVLGDLVELGHRLGNHTLHHVLLGGADARTVQAELEGNQRALDPLLVNELRIFRAPGGSWSAAASAAVDADPYLSRIVGPLHWDIDRKDWEGSLYCRSDRQLAECEAARPASQARVRASIVAQRYLATIEGARRGVVLLHDRVGHVGSDYALEIARALVPQLKARGFVFAAPVLRFSPLEARADVGAWSSLHVADVDGDGRGDVCGRGPAGIACARSTTVSGPDDRVPRTVFVPLARARPLADAGVTAASSIRLADLDGDGQSDVCVRGALGVECALADASGAFGTFQAWSRARRVGGEDVAEFSDEEGWATDPTYAKTLRLGDLDGDGKDDVCGRSAAGVTCARSGGAGLEPARLWLRELDDAHGWRSREHGASLQLADVDGDGRADVCARDASGIVCARSTGRGFGRLERWSVGRDFADGGAVPWTRSPSYWSSIRFGDLNGDGRADVCGRGPAGLVCALSTGRGFLEATLWSADLSDAAGWLEEGATVALGDVNGDGRADVCARRGGVVSCGMAP